MSEDCDECKGGPLVVVGGWVGGGDDLTVLTGGVRPGAVLGGW